MSLLHPNHLNSQLCCAENTAAWKTIFILRIISGYSQSFVSLSGKVPAFRLTPRSDENKKLVKQYLLYFPIHVCFLFFLSSTLKGPQKNYSPLLNTLSLRLYQTYLLALSDKGPEYESISCSDSTNRKEYRSRDQSWNFYQSSRFKSHILADPIKLRGGS